MTTVEKAMRHDLEVLGIDPVKRLENPTTRPRWHRYPAWAQLRLLADAFQLVAVGFKNCAPSKAARK